MPARLLAYETLRAALAEAGQKTGVI